MKGSEENTLDVEAMENPNSSNKMDKYLTIAKYSLVMCVGPNDQTRREV